MYYLKTSACFDSAHFLHGYNGKCANIHGHHWVVEVKISGEKLQGNSEKRGMLLDFGDFKKVVKDIADGFDHTLIYEKKPLNLQLLPRFKKKDFHWLKRISDPLPKTLPRTYMPSFAKGFARFQRYGIRIARKLRGVR